MHLNHESPGSNNTRQATRDEYMTMSPSFVFSEGYATSESPIVITIPGRKLTDADREHRVGLQKYWLSRNVPKEFELQRRSLVQCDLKRPDEFAACDRYVFVDPESKQQFNYYIYVGNWP